jgi:hypothetical protein
VALLALLDTLPLETVPEPYPGRIAYFKARSRRRGDPRHPEWFWVDLALGGIEIQPVPGNPETLFEPSNLKVLAEKLQNALARWGSPSGAGLEGSPGRGYDLQVRRNP